MNRRLWNIFERATTRRVAAWVAIAPLMGGARLSHGQTGGAQSEAVTAQRDSYLAEAHLLKPLAAGLRQRLTRATGEAKAELAKELGLLYAKMLNLNPAPEDRQALERWCRQLLTEMPDADAPALKLTLAIAGYLPIEGFVERRELHISEPEEDAEAERVLRGTAQEFIALASKLNTKVKELEIRKSDGAVSEDRLEALRAELDLHIELRSKAAFHAGWANYYLALMTGADEKATEAMKQFGVVLNAVHGSSATVDRLTQDYMHFPHIAKAALGCALSSSLLKKHVEAARWIEAVENTAHLPPEVLDQLLRRKIQVFAAANKWNDLDVAIIRSRQPDRSAPATPLALIDARMLAVASLEALKRGDLPQGLKSIAEGLVKTAMGDLVTRGEVGHVVSLAKTYGTSLIGQEGFINRYVRSLRAFDEVRESHKSAAANAAIPTAIPDLVNRYRQSAALFDAAVATSDAEKYPALRATALLCEGLSLFYAGAVEDAADKFEQAFEAAKVEELRGNALWYAIVALDWGIKDGKKSLTPRHQRLATLYIKSFPRATNATALLLAQIRAGQKAGSQEIDTLLKVAPDSPVYESARRVACDLLYNSWRRAVDKSRDFYAIRFADVAEDLLKLEYAHASAPDQTEGRKIAEEAINRARRLADVLLMCVSPDVPRAEAALTMVESLASLHGISLGNKEEEIVYRRLQVALAKRDMAAADRALTQLRGIGGTYLPAAERLMYRRVVELWTSSPQEASNAQQVVAIGSRVLTLKDWGDAALAAVRDKVAEAAAFLWTERRDTVMRDVAMRLDKEQLDLGRRTIPSLRRLAQLREETGDIDGSAACWVELLAASNEDSDAWLECRHESIRVIAKRSREEALGLLDQFKALHPVISSKAWSERFAALDQSVRTAASNPLGPKAPASAPPRGGGGPK